MNNERAPMAELFDFYADAEVAENLPCARHRSEATCGATALVNIPLKCPKRAQSPNPRPSKAAQYQFTIPCARATYDNRKCLAILSLPFLSTVPTKLFHEFTTQNQQPKRFAQTLSARLRPDPAKLK